MSISDTPGKTPQEILKDLIEAIGPTFYLTEDVAIAETLRRLHALIRGEVIGEDEDAKGIELVALDLELL